MKGDPLDPRLYFLTLVIEEVLVMLPVGGDELAEAIVDELAEVGGALLAEIETHDADPMRLADLWERMLAILAKLEDGCAGGPLLVLLSDDLKDFDQRFRGELDLCFAHALEQAVVLLPADDDLTEAVETLVGETEKHFPDRLELGWARDTVWHSMQQMAERCTGGALALLMLEWLEHRSL